MSQYESFCIYHEDLGASDDGATLEEIGAKIIYYYPDHISLSMQLNQLHLCEGIIGFTSHFTQKQDFISIQTAKHHYFMCKCEKSIWIILSVLHDSKTNINCNAMKEILSNLYNTISFFFGTLSSQLEYNSSTNEKNGKEILSRIRAKRKDIRKKKEKVETNSWNKEESSDELLKSIDTLVKDVEELLLNSPISYLRKRLQNLVPVYLDSLNIRNLHFFHSLEGFHYFPIDQPTFLSMHSFLNKLRINVGKDLRKMSFLIDGHLVWSDLEQSQMKTIYNFLRLKESEALKREKTVEFDSTESLWSIKSLPLAYVPIWGNRKDILVNSTFGLFLTENSSGSLNKGFLGKDHHFLSTDESCFLDKVWAPIIHPEDKSERLLIYHMNRITLLVLINHETDYFNICKRIESNATIEDIKSLTRKIFHPFTHPALSPKQPYSFIYFNHENLALKFSGISNGKNMIDCSRYPPNINTLSNLLPESVLDILDHFHTTFQCNNTGTRELCVKTPQHGWVLGRSYADRELYILISNKISNVVGVQEYVEGIINTYFRSILV